MVWQRPVAGTPQGMRLSREAAHVTLRPLGSPLWPGRWHGWARQSRSQGPPGPLQLGIPRACREGAQTTPASAPGGGAGQRPLVAFREVALSRERGCVLGPSRGCGGRGAGGSSGPYLEVQGVQRVGQRGGGSSSSRGASSAFVHFVRLQLGHSWPAEPPHYPSHQGPTVGEQLGRAGNPAFLPRPPRGCSALCLCPKTQRCWVQAASWHHLTSSNDAPRPLSSLQPLQWALFSCFREHIPHSHLEICLPPHFGSCQGAQQSPAGLL